MSVHAVTAPSGHVISDDRGLLDLREVHEVLSGTYWARDRPLPLTERSWANCLVAGIRGADGTLAGFGRVLTDYSFRAHLGDVVILPASRGLGLGKALVRFFLDHPALETVDTWTLTTDDAHGLYRGFGFSPWEGNGKWMVLHRAAAG